MTETQEMLQAYYTAKHQDRTNLRIEGLANLNSGWESDVYAFDLAYELDSQHYKRPLILRIYPGEDAREKSRREYEGMLVLFKVGYPVPQVFILAWTLLLMGSYEGDQVRQLILAEYERQSGSQIEQLDFFDVFACIRRLGSVLISIRTGAENLGMRPGAEALMLRQLPALLRVYQLMVDRTEIAVPEIELLFKENGLTQ